MVEKKVSVIIPVYNAEKYLRRCVESVLGQSYGDLELVLVDDGSTDSSGAICDEYASCDVRVRVVHQENRGVSAARNAGLRVATGEYVVFVDSDDSVLSDYVHNLVSAGDDDYVAAGCYVQNKDGTWSEWHNVPKKITIDEIERNSKKIHEVPTGTVWSHRYKRNKIVDNGLWFSEDVSRGEDTLFNCRYLRICESIVILDTLDYRYYHHDTSATAKFNPNLFRCSMESVLAIGEIIGTDTQAFRERVWGNAMAVCDNYALTTRKGTINEKIRSVYSVHEICKNRYVRECLPYEKRGERKITALLIQWYIYPVYFFFRCLL